MESKDKPQVRAHRFGKSRFGKARQGNCECTVIFTCRVCLEYAAARNTAEQYPKAD